MSRSARGDAQIADVRIPAGARVLVIFASANRDEREWDDPDTFDIRRDANRHLGFGQGRMRVPVRPWRVWRHRRCCAHCSIASTGSN